MVSIKDSIIPDPIMIAISSHSISNIGMTNINPDMNIITNNVNDAYFYVEAPWIKDLSKYNMNVDESMYMDIDKYNGKYVFPMGRVGAYNSYIKFDNDSNILPGPQPDNEISIEALLYLNTQ